MFAMVLSHMDRDKGNWSFRIFQNCTAMLTGGRILAVFELPRVRVPACFFAFWGVRGKMIMVQTIVQMFECQQFHQFLTPLDFFSTLKECFGCCVHDPQIGGARAHNTTFAGALV